MALAMRWLRSVIEMVEQESSLGRDHCYCRSTAHTATFFENYSLIQLLDMIYIDFYVLYSEFNVLYIAYSKDSVTLQKNSGGVTVGLIGEFSYTRIYPFRRHTWHLVRWPVRARNTKMGRFRFQPRYLNKISRINCTKQIILFAKFRASNLCTFYCDRPRGCGPQRWSWTGQSRD